MPNVTVRGIPDVLYQDIKHLATQRHRSVNSQIIVSLSEHVSRRKTTRRIIQEIEEIHAGIDVKGFSPTQEELKETIEEGRL